MGMLLCIEQLQATFRPITGRTPVDDKYQPQIEDDDGNPLEDCVSLV